MALYKQTVTFTKDMESAGAQRHIGKITKLDPALKAGFLKIAYYRQVNDLGPLVPGDPAPNTPGITVYLSNASANNGWDDDAVLTARATGPMSGTVSLAAYRSIETNESIDDSSLGPVHVWAEITDVTATVDIEVRYTIEAWGRSILLEEDSA